MTGVLPEAKQPLLPAGVAPQVLRAMATPLRLLPGGLGQPRIAHKLHHRWLPAQTRPRRARVGRATMTLDLRDTMQAEAYLLGGYELELVNFIARELAGGGRLVDVGANIGLITLPVVAANPRIEAIAFEPHPGNAAALRANLATNPGLRVEVREIALGAERGQVRLTNDDAQESGWFRVAENGGDAGVPVTMDTLDSALGPDVEVDVIKVDAEGSEPAIMRGAERILREQRVRCLVMEVNAGHGVTAEELETFLARCGYRREQLPAPLGRRLRGLGHDTAVFRAVTRP